MPDGAGAGEAAEEAPAAGNNPQAANAGQNQQGAESPQYVEMSLDGRFGRVRALPWRALCVARRRALGLTLPSRALLAPQYAEVLGTGSFKTVYAPGAARGGRGVGRGELRGLPSSPVTRLLTRRWASK